MLFWKRWLPWMGSRDAAKRRLAASSEATGDTRAPACKRPDQARKCFKLDYILAAFGLPGLDAKQNMSERCKLCAAIGSAEPWDCWEHWDKNEPWTR